MEKQPQGNTGWKYGRQETEPVSSDLTQYYDQESDYHHPMANMLARGVILTSRSHEGVNADLNDLEE